MPMRKIQRVPTTSVGVMRKRQRRSRVRATRFQLSFSWGRSRDPGSGGHSGHREPPLPSHVHGPHLIVAVFLPHVLDDEVGIVNDGFYVLVELFLTCVHERQTWGRGGGSETGSEGLPPPKTPAPPLLPVSPWRDQGSRAGVTRLASPCRSDCFSNISSLRDLTLKYSSALAM